MSPASYPTLERSSAGTERAIPFIPDQRVSYERASADYAYEIHPAASFHLDYQRGNGYWIVRDVETGIFGAGKRLLKARRDFERAVEQHLDVLERQQALSEELSWQLTYLRERVRR